MSRRLTAAALAAVLSATVLVGATPAAAAVEPPAALASVTDEDGDLRLSWAHQPGATGYTVEVSTSPEFPIGSATVTTTTYSLSYVPPVSLVAAAEAENLYWRVAAHTSGVAVTSRGAFSDVQVAEVPAARTPAPLAPGVTDGGVVTYPDPVSFRWSPVPGAAGYTVQWSSDPAFPVGSTTTSVTTTATTHTPALPLSRMNGSTPITWYWRVQANLWSGGTSTLAGPWSGTSSFVITWPAAVSAPRLTWPSPWVDESDPGLSDVRFSWQPVPGASSYTVHVGTAKSDDGTLVTNPVPSAGGTTTATSFVPTVTLLDQNYYWQVVANDASGVPGTPSQVRQFRKLWGGQLGETATPTGVTFPAPTPGIGTPDPDEPTLVPFDEFELSWQGVPRASYYEVEVVPLNGDPRLTCRTASTSATIIGTHSAGSGTPGALQGASTCLWTGTPDKRIQPDRTYRWRVRAVDLSGSSTTGIQAAPPTGSLVSAWSDPESAGQLDRVRYIRVTPGTVPVAEGSEPDATAWQVQTGTALRGQPSPVFMWNPAVGANGYEVTVALNADMTNVVSVSRTPSTRLRLTGVFGNNETGLPYYWKVEPFVTTNWSTFAYVGPGASADRPSWRRVSTATDFVDQTVASTADDGTVLLRWRPQFASAPLDGGSRGYQVAISNSSGQSMGTAKVEYPFFVASVPSTSTTVRALPPGTYTFTVAPLDANGAPGRPSTPQQFVVSAPAPTAGPVHTGPSSAVLTWSTQAAATRFELEYWNVATPGTRITPPGTQNHRQRAMTLVDLPPGTYGWQVRSVDADGNRSAFSAVNHVSISGSVPQLTTPEAAVLPTTGRVLDWDPVPDASRYLVQIATTPGGLDSAAPIETRATAFALTAQSGVPAPPVFGTTYYWRVRAVAEKVSGSVSTRIVLGQSATRSFSTLTLPGQVTVAAPTVAGKDLSVSWTPLTGAAAGAPGGLTYVVRYRVKSVPETAWTELPPTAAGAASMVLTDLMTDTTYQVEVAARNSEGQGPWSVTRERLTATTPGAPTNVSVTPGLGSLAVRWTNPSGTASGGVPLTGVLLRYRSSSASAWSTVPLSATTTSHTLSGLSQKTPYFVEVVAVNGVGQGPAAAASATTMGAPSAPTSVTAARGAGKVTVRWAAPSDDGGSPITGYTVQLRSYSGTTWSSWSTKVSPAATATSATITGLTNGRKYQVRVLARTSIASSPASTAVTFIPATKPSPPTSVKATATSGKIRITWAKPPTNGSTISGYVIQYSTNRTTWRTLKSLSASARSYTWTGGTKGKTYYFRIYAKSNLGNSGYSSVVSARKV